MPIDIYTMILMESVLLAKRSFNEQSSVKGKCIWRWTIWAWACDMGSHTRSYLCVNLPHMVSVHCIIIFPVLYIKNFVTSCKSSIMTELLKDPRYNLENALVGPLWSVQTQQGHSLQTTRSFITNHIKSELSTCFDLVEWAGSEWIY